MADCLVRERKRISDKMRQEIFEKYEGRCAYCGKKFASRKDMRVDHVHAVALGGADDINNYLPACHDCNFYKSSFCIEDFRENLSGIVERLAKREITFRLAVAYGLISINDNKKIDFLFDREK